jgi:hypothetical protein
MCRHRNRTRLVPVALSVFSLLALLGPRAPGQGNDLPNKAGWHVLPDPGETFKGPFNLGGSIPVGFQGTVLFPSTPSAFVAVTPPKTKDVYQVYDLRTMAAVGKPVAIPNRFSPFTRPALAPDGKHLAARVKDGATSTVEVWSVETGKSVLKLPPEADDNIKPKYVDLLGGDRLWVARHPSEFPRYTVRTTFEVRDINTGREVARFSNPLVPLGKWYTLSAGRRYQFMEQTGGWFLFLVWDLHTGKMVGEREFQDRKAAWGQAAGLAFSPDGEEMAMLWRLGQRPDTWGRLLVFETRSGKRLYDHRIGYDLPQIDSLWSDGGTRCLQCWPERRGWLLFGHLLIDRESGAVVHKVGAAPGFSGAIEDRRFLDAYHLTDLEGGFDRRLKVLALPRGEIEAAVKKARGK